MITFRGILFFAFLWIIDHGNDAALCGNNDCVHGVCVNDLCKCSECYTGPSCEFLQNHSPQFEKSTYQVTILPTNTDDTALVKVFANDEDQCLNTDCGCGTIIYSILDESSKVHFIIDPTTGEIKVISGLKNLKGENSLIVKATNRSPFDNLYDTATVFINAGTSEEPILERHRRDTSPSSFLFTLNQVFPTQTLTSINIGQRLSFQLIITFPVANSTFNVELFAPENPTEPAMMLCDTNVSYIGASLVVTSISAPILQGVNNAVWPYTHITYAFVGIGNNVVSPPNISTVQIIISFDAVMLYANTTVNGNTYYVSAGAEYSNSTEIWVGQSSYVVNMVTPTPVPNIVTIGDTAISPGTTTAFTLVVVAPVSYLFFNLQVLTPLNNSAAMSLCAVNRYYVGISYSCLPVTFNQPNLTSVSISNKIYYTSALMNLGPLTNRYFMEPTHTNPAEVTFNVSITARVSPTIWVGSYYYLGISLGYSPTAIFTQNILLPVLAATPWIPYNGAIVTTLDYFRNVTSVSIGSPGKMILAITVPSGTTLDYNVTVSFQSNVAEICGVSFHIAGLNIPCIDQANITSSYVMSADNYAVSLTATIGGVRSYPISTVPTDDILQLMISFRPINDSRNTAGSSIQSSVKVSWQGGTSAVLTNSFLLNPPDVANITALNLPVFSFGLNGNNGNVSVGSIYQLNFTMQLQPGTLYTPSSLEFYMPFNNTIQIGMCSITVSYVGKKVLCFNPGLIVPKFVFSSKINDTSNYDKLQIPTGVLCSDGPTTRIASMDDMIMIIINLIVWPNPINTVGSTTNINAGMMITTSQIWVGNQPITFVTPVAPPSLIAPNIPLIIAQRVDATNNYLWQNDLAIIQYVIKIAPLVVSVISLTISTDITVSDNFGVCSMKVIGAGSSIPCFNTSLTSTQWNPYSKFNKQATLTFTNILNAGSVPLKNSPAFDENSILVEVIVKFGPSTPASCQVLASLAYNSGTANANLPFVLQSLYSRVNGTNPTTEPTFTMVLYPLFNNSLPNINNIAYGESMRSVVTVQIVVGAIQTLKFLFASAPNSMNQMDVVSVNILSVGRNIPCLQMGMLPFVIQKRSLVSKDYNSVDLGTICHKQYLPNTTIQDNMISMEAVFRVWRIPILAPTTLQINSIALLNNDQIYITRITFNASVGNPFTTSLNLLGQNITFTAVTSTPTVTIGGIFNVTFNILIPPYTSYLISNVIVYSQQLTGSDSYCFVAGNVNYTGSSGTNIGINNNEPMSMILTSSLNTSQMNNIIASLGIVQNSATTYRMIQNNYTIPNADDTISITIPLKMTDNSQTPNGLVINFLVGLVFDTFVQNTTLQVTVVRTNNEPISLNTTTTLLTSNSIYSSATPINVMVVASLINTSLLECRNFTIHVASPPFLSLTSVTNMSYSSPGYSIVQTNLSPGGFYFLVPYFFYSDNISIVFSMSVQANLNLTQNRESSIVTIPIIYACQTFNWPSNPLGNKWINTVNSIQFMVQGNSVNISNCNNNLMLTNNAIIQDCAISAYMSPVATNGVLNIRSNSGSYWIPHVRSGQYNKLRYVDIRFGTLTTVSKIIVTSTTSNKPQIISVYGSMDGRVYSSYQNYSLLYSGNVAETTLVNPSFTYRAIRVGIANATQDDLMTGLNLDLIGCPPAGYTDTNTFNPCTVASLAVPSVPLSEYYYRGYLYSPLNLFVCDEIASRKKSLETFPRCFRSTINTNTWEDLGPQVGKVIGFDGVNLIIYAIASDLKSYIMSEDNGQTWIGTNPSGWNMQKTIGNLISPTIIPWINDTTFNSMTTGSNCTKYNTGTVYFCYDGIYSATMRLFAWNDCCYL